MLEFVSLFTGVGGFDLGFERAGMKCVTQVEIDDDCNVVLRRHYPEVWRFTDVRGVGKRELPTAGVLTGGFPCQDVSVAGSRKGLAGKRSGLWFEFARIIDELGPKWVVIENVPGLLSSQEGRDFQTVLSGLVQRGYGVAWRVFDARYFRIAQRRRRVFIVASLGNGGSAQVLFEREGLFRYPAQSRAEGENPTTYSVRSSQTGSNGWGVAEDVTGTVDTNGGWNVAGTLDRKSTSSDRGSQSNETEFIVPVAFSASRDLRDVGDDISPTLTHGGEGESAKGAFAKVSIMQGFGDYVDGDTASSLKTRDYKDATDLVCWEMQHASEVYRETGDLSPNLQARMGTGGNNVPLVGIRRLTPTECERLQGFPDGWTAHQSDSVRYRQLGNAVCVPVAQWIGERIVQVERNGKV